jgi:hypothetical protein
MTWTAVPRWVAALLLLMCVWLLSLGSNLYGVDGAAVGIHNDPISGAADKSRFGWVAYKPPVIAGGTKSFVDRLKGKRSFELVQKPVYVSITTISQRLSDVHKTIWQLLNGTVIPDQIYLFISPTPFLLDKGITSKDVDDSTELQLLVRHYPVTIIFTENIGPHRKLLPLLDNKWNEDCLIITFDDEPKYWLENYIHQLLHYYIATNGTSVVTLKARRVSFCHIAPFKILSYSSWGEALYGMHEFFLLPTGTGGILYRPRFFNPVVFNRNYINITKTTDDLAFRLATMVNGIFVATGCRKTRMQVTSELRHGSNISRACTDGVYLAPSKSFHLLNSSSRLLMINNKPAAALLSTVVADDPNGRRLSDGGLFGAYNRKKGNDNSFYAALNYLQRQKLIDMSALATALLPVERDNCFTNGIGTDFSAKAAFPGGSISCMVSKCRKPNYSQALLNELGSDKGKEGL